jgi:hypothetical protein
VADAQRYLDHISAYDREFEGWIGRVKKITKRYKLDDRKTTSQDGVRFPVLWSNVQTLKAATYARTPRPDVARRFRDYDPAGRVAALLMERALDFEVRTYPDFAQTMLHVVYDRFLGGRGTAWVRYEPITKMVEIPSELPLAVPGEPAAQITDNEPPETEKMEVLDWECAPVDYVHWNDFGHNVCRTWEEVSVVWRKVYLSRGKCVERFGTELGKAIPLDANPSDDQKTNDAEGIQKRALIYEIWDKDEGCALWLSKSMGKILDERDDPLELDGFFPCPRPIFSTLTTDSLVPTPDFTLYQDQANELDTLADRIDGLIDQLKIRGFYDASQPELSRLFKEAGNGDLIPVNSWQNFAEKKGLSGSVDLVDILPIAQALKEAYGAFEQVKQQIYELTGISDILRGQTKASETATAQQIKNSYASLRLKVYQDEVERFATDLFRLKAQIIASKFEPDTFLRMSAAQQLQPADQPYIMPAVQLLKDKLTREFRIEVETDSMAFQDEQQDKQDRMEFLTATSTFIQKLTQAAEQSPQLLPLGVEMLKFGVTGFRIGKTLEGVIDQAAEQITQQVEQQAQQPKPNPEMAKVQAQQQSEQAKLQYQQHADQARGQVDMQIAGAKAQADMQIEQAKGERDMQLERERMAMQAHKEEAERQQALALETLKAQAQQATEAMRIEWEREKAALAYRQAIEIAEIGAKATLDAAQMTAAKQASE